MVKKEVIEFAYNKGYRVDNDGNLISPSNKKLKIRKSTTGYYETNIRICGKLFHLPVHRLLAYQKYGDIMFAADCIRHLDGNPLNNTFDNLEIGTNSDNRLDMPEDVRIRIATIASHSNPKYHNNEFVRDVREYYNKERSYKKTMEKFGITSKGTLYHMLNVRNLS